MVGGDTGANGSAHRSRAWPSLGWAVFLAVVLGLRVLSVGDDPPAARAAAADPPATADQEAAALAAQRITWIVEGAAPLEPSAEVLRCLRAGAPCSPDELLDVDTTRARAASLAGALDGATDPTGDGYLGEPTAEVAERVAGTRAAAAAVDEALTGWLARGCGGAVDGVPVDERPAECDALGAAGADALSAFRAAFDGWFAAA